MADVDVCEEGDDGTNRFRCIEDGEGDRLLSVEEGVEELLLRSRAGRSGGRWW